MITPRFSVRQDETRVYVTIHAPHVRAQTIEFDVDEDQFKFFASPYYLRLTFPGKVIEDEAATASLDAANGDILVSLSKQTPGEEFINLDLLTSLLATRRERESEQTESDGRAGRPGIEEIGGTISAEDQEAILNDEEFEWEIPQSLANPDIDTLLMGSAKYGFNEQYIGFLEHVHSTANEINEVEDPENMSAEDRRQRRVAIEDAKFDEDYYMSNYINDEDIQPLIQYKTAMYSTLRQIQKANKDDNTAGVTSTSGDDSSTNNLIAQLEFTDEEKKTMMDLPRKTHIIANRQAVYLGLVDIVFAYSLDQRANLGESTVESAWAVGAVSPSLSNLEQFTTLQSVLVGCFRRGLAYPLYRNWELCEKALEDVYVVFKLGRRALLKTMLQVKELFDKHDVFYVYSKIFLDDYCVWLQTQASDKAIRSLAHKLHSFEVEKDDIGWNLDAFEDLALQTSESEAEEDSEVVDAEMGEMAGEVDFGEEHVDSDSAHLEGLSLAAQGRVQPSEQQAEEVQSRRKLVQIIGGDDDNIVDTETSSNSNVGTDVDASVNADKDANADAAQAMSTWDNATVQSPASALLSSIMQSGSASGNDTKSSRKKPLIELIDDN